MDAAQKVGDAIRCARRGVRMSQREYAQQLGINPSRLARLEINAGRQPLEIVALVLQKSGFELSVQPAVDSGPGSRGSPGSPDSPGSPGSPDEADAYEPSRPLGMFDAAGRHLPAHCEPYRLSTPHSWWFVRNGGWVTRAAQPTWSYECPARSNPTWWVNTARSNVDTAWPETDRPSDVDVADQS
jgi:transcriptional regulator with XRE-family HTH domain